VLSGRGLCDELITRPEESYRLWCVIVCDLETSRIDAPYIYIYDISSLRVKEPSGFIKCWEFRVALMKRRGALVHEVSLIREGRTGLWKCVAQLYKDKLAITRLNGLLRCK